VKKDRFHCAAIAFMEVIRRYNSMEYVFEKRW
jgi:hypothetical protein